MYTQNLKCVRTDVTYIINDLTEQCHSLVKWDRYWWKYRVGDIEIVCRRPNRTIAFDVALRMARGVKFRDTKKRFDAMETESIVMGGVEHVS